MVFLVLSNLFNPCITRIRQRLTWRRRKRCPFLLHKHHKRLTPPVTFLSGWVAEPSTTKFPWSFIVLNGEIGLIIGSKDEILSVILGHDDHSDYVGHNNETWLPSEFRHYAADSVITVERFLHYDVHHAASFGIAQPELPVTRTATKRILSLWPRMTTRISSLRTSEGRHYHQLNHANFVIMTNDDMWSWRIIEKFLLTSVGVCKCTDNTATLIYSFNLKKLTRNKVFSAD